ncbi:MAG: nitroreductase family protein [Ruminococcus sp.]|nr:nitroreductase family protein [Ruminococcus sp.]
MDYSQLIGKRRSVRRYQDKSITREQAEELIRAAQEAPSWKNQQTGRYRFIITKETADRVRQECLPQFNAVRSANAALIVTSFVKGNVGFDDKGQPINELGDGWGCYDLGLQGAYILLKAADMGLSTLVMGIRDQGRLRELLDIPETEEIGAVIAVGYADQSPERPARKELSEIAEFI